ncbi:MAG: polysaccharide pyruvyl transferase family protein [Opitutaceae bacterium]|nr:polysaccharide pyruvyl transferase family protein [Opitutaceae bacterium]
MLRRHFLQLAAGSAALASAGTPAGAAVPRTRPRILLREALQYENIGDVGRVPGTIRLFYRHLPDAEITLWPWSLHEREREMLTRAFPRLRIAEGETDARGKPSTPALAEAWSAANFFVSPAKNARTYTEWAATGRPFGLFGASFDPITDRRTRPQGLTLRELRAEIERLPRGEFEKKFGPRAFYEKAAFIYARDMLGLRFLQREELKPGVLDFGPEGCFALDLRDEARAADWRKRHRLSGDDYICVIPRLRYTPYYRVKNLPRSAGDYEIDALNDASAAADHAALRDLIVRWVRQTGARVVACPEMTYQIATAKEQLIDPLPEDVKTRVVWRDTFWLPDEAAALYARARAVVSAECHSPIIALAAGTPILHIRNPVDTTKGQMFADLGLGDWLFESTEASGEQLWSALRTIHEDLLKARQRVAGVMSRVAALQRGMTESIGRAIKPA